LRVRDEQSAFNGDRIADALHLIEKSLFAEHGEQGR
jgi:hypothetical protein